MNSFVLKKYWTDVIVDDPKKLGRPKLKKDSCILRSKKNEPLVEIYFDTRIAKIKAKRDYSDCVLLPVLYAESDQPNLRDLYLNRNRIGWVVPVPSIAESASTLDLYSGQEKEKIERAINIASWGLLFDERCIQFFRFSGEASSDLFPIDQMYSADTAVVIIDKTQLPRYTQSRTEIKTEILASMEIELIRKGYSISPNHESESLAPRRVGGSDGALHLKSLSSDLNPEIEIIRDLLDEAVQVESPIICFFLLYQAIEVLSYVTFSCARGQIGRRLTSIEGPHEYRDFLDTLNKSLLVDYAKTRGLLRKIFHLHLRGQSTLSIRQVDDSSKIFLEHIGYHIEEKDIFDATYSTRNQVIHSQAKWKQNQEALTLLWAVDENLLTMIGDVLRGFSLSDGKKGIWRTLVK